MTTPTDEKAPEAAEEAATEPQQAPEAPEGAQPAADAPEPPEPTTIDEVVDEATISKAVVSTPAGSLTLRPTQKALDPEQHAALKAIGIDTQADPGVIPHVRAFVHMCQIRGLDPFAREAYLIGRGKGDNRKYTMQTGIDGYRKMGAATGRFLRVKKVLWTGRDDDDRSYVRVEDEDGDVVMKRIWFDQWPAERGEPGAAKVVIEHIDEDGQITTTGAVANWEMYAPYNDLWEYDASARKRVQRYDDKGKPIKVLGEMWAKGGPHMLAKCAEALAYRMAFPAKMSGIYVTEEMHRLDQQERDRQSRERTSARHAAFAASQQSQRALPEAGVDDDVEDAVLVDEPTKVDEAVTEAVTSMRVDADEAQRLLRLELDFQSDVLGQPVRTLAKRTMMKVRRDLDALTADDLLPLVNGLRSMTVEAAKRNTLPEADAYAAVATDGAGPIDVDALSPEDAPDPDGLHQFDADPDVPEECRECGLREDIGNHPEAQA